MGLSADRAVLLHTTSIARASACAEVAAGNREHGQNRRDWGIAHSTPRLPWETTGPQHSALGPQCERSERGKESY